MIDLERREIDELMFLILLIIKSFEKWKDLEGK